MEHKQVPYHNNPGNACALACYTMVAQYLLPELNITFGQLGKIAGWNKGYAVWAFPVWKWLMDKGLYITDYDVIDYDSWATKGFDSLKGTLAEDEFNFYKEVTYDLNKVGKQIKLTYRHPNFTYEKKKLSWIDVVTEFNKPGICDLTLNSRALNHLEGFIGHRVVLIDITDTEVIFHDPNKKGTGAYRHEPIEHFKTVFENIDGPELARYSLEKTWLPSGVNRE